MHDKTHGLLFCDARTWEALHTFHPYAGGMNTLHGFCFACGNAEKLLCHCMQIKTNHTALDHSKGN